MEPKVKYLSEKDLEEITKKQDEAFSNFDLDAADEASQPLIEASRGSENKGFTTGE